MIKKNNGNYARSHYCFCNDEYINDFGISRNKGY